MPGEIVHLEIPADDVDAAVAFYSGLFGWEPQQMEGAPGEYRMVRLGENQGAAITGMEPGTVGARPYIDVADIDGAIARARELGGQAADRMPVPGMGWFSVCTDPHGNAFGLWEADETATM